MAYRTMNEVIEVAEQREDAENFFRTGLAQGSWGDARSQELVREWLRRLDAHRDAMAQQAALSAAERSATAAEGSAEAAGRSSRWAGWAIAISIAALLVSALPLILK